MIFDEESASDAQKFLAPPKRVIVEKKIDAKIWKQKKSQKKKLGVEKWNVTNRLKSAFPKFHVDRSHVRGVNVVHTVFAADLAPKMTFILFFSNILA